MLELIGIIFIIGFAVGWLTSKKEVDNLRIQVAQLSAALQAQTTKHNVQHHQPESKHQTNVQLQQTAVQDNQDSFQQDAVINHVDNAVILLYLGAFLFLGAVGLFLAFGGLPGAAKTLLVALLVVCFYATGLQLSNQTRLKPAGVAFLGIGMVLMPFLGLAAHVYLFDRQAGALVWTLTSVLSIGLYTHALIKTRQPYVNYFMLAAVLSLFEAGVALVELPVYYFAWMMALVGIIYLLVLRIKGIWLDVQQALKVSSSVLVPAAIAFSIFSVPVYGLFELSLTLALAGAYYWLAVYLEAAGNQQDEYVALADMASIAAVLSFVYSFSHDFTVFSVIAISIAFGQLLFLAYRHLKGEALAGAWSNIGAVTAIVPLVAVLSSLDNAPLLTSVFATAIAVWTGLFLVMSRSAYLAAALGGSLLLPLIMGFYLFEPEWSAHIFVIVYGVITGLIFIMRRILQNFDHFDRVIKTSFYLALIIALYSSMFGGLYLFSVSLLILSAVFIALSYYEPQTQRRTLFVLGLASQHLATICLVAGATSSSSEQMYVLPVSLSLLGLLHYGAAMVLDVSELRRQYIRFSAIGAFAIAAATVMVYEQTTFPMILALFATAGLLYFEGQHNKSVTMQEFALGVAMAAIQWLLYLVGLREFLVYSHLWALFFANLAVQRYARGDLAKEYSYTLTALMILSLPLAIVALGNQGQLYGWLLIIEHLLLLLLGMVINRPLVRQWGLWVSVMAVLYQLRDLTFLALGFLAIVLISIAIRVLQKNYDDNGSK